MTKVTLYIGTSQDGAFSTPIDGIIMGNRSYEQNYSYIIRRRNPLIPPYEDFKFTQTKEYKAGIVQKIYVRKKS